ncbi:gap junction beta-4 protein [Wolffia australiana]
MGKLICEASPAMAEAISPSPPLLSWPDPSKMESNNPWNEVRGLEEQQRRCLRKLYAGGVFWKKKDDSAAMGTVFRLVHGGDVEADGNCLFTASRRAMGLLKVGARELRQRTVRRFLEDYASDGPAEKEAVDDAIRHLYSPDLKAGWGIHVVQEVKLLARKADREVLDSAIQELLDLGLQRETAAETIYKERCIPVGDASSWAKYMSISGSPEDEHDIITLQYTEEGLLTVDENREGHAAAFGDDIAIACLSTEFGREIFVVQAHGLDAMVDEENCIFFLPHCPRGQMNEPPFFLFMKGTGWCGAGADHYEPLISQPAPLVAQDKAAFVL